jgi:DNA-binding Lrp family transcriptional regulator
MGAGIGQIRLLWDLISAWAASAWKGIAAALKVSNPSLGYLASHARIAIHIREFSPQVVQMWHRTRNKIAQVAAAALRQLPIPPHKLCRLRTWTRVSKNLDEIDLRILSEIQADGRITNVELAKRVGISPPPCLRRVRTLEEEGYIQGYRGLLDPRRLGFDVTVFASVHLSSQADADLRAFEDFVRAEPLVRECWMLSGEVDFILKCVAPDMATFQDFVTHLTAAPHVRNVRTSLVLHNSKYEAAVPLDLKVLS